MDGAVSCALSHLRDATYHQVSGVLPMTTHTNDEVRPSAEEWARRQKANVRLGYLFGAVAFALFLVALWKYRPL